jgi:hypothetical protein
VVLVLRPSLDEESIATVLMDDDVTFDTFSPSHETKVKKKMLVGGDREMDYRRYPGHYLPVYQFQCIAKCGGE